MMQISRGIEFLHSKKIVHRDIKPANILLKTEQENICVKLGDFGLCKLLELNGTNSAMSSNVGTHWFQAPEFWDRKYNDRVKPYHRNVDVDLHGDASGGARGDEPGART